MLAARWNAHALNAPGKFLVSAPEHERPNRARAYLITDEAVSDTAARYAATRPDLDPISRHAIEARPHPAATEPAATSTHPDWPDDAASDPGPDSGTAAALWQALKEAPTDGAGVRDLMRASGMSRPTLYRHLAWHSRTGRVTQVRRGRWTARTHPGPGTGPGRR